MRYRIYLKDSNDNTGHGLRQLTLEQAKKLCAELNENNSEIEYWYEQIDEDEER